MNDRTIELLDNLYGRDEKAIQAVIDGLWRELSGSNIRELNASFDESDGAKPRLRYIPPDDEATDSTTAV